MFSQSSPSWSACPLPALLFADDADGLAAWASQRREGHYVRDVVDLQPSCQPAPGQCAKVVLHHLVWSHPQPPARHSLARAPKSHSLYVVSWPRNRVRWRFPPFLPGEKITCNCRLLLLTCLEPVYQAVQAYLRKQFLHHEHPKCIGKCRQGMSDNFGPAK